MTCPLDSLEQARSHKQNKVEHHQILSELDCLNVTNFYETLEVSVLVNFQSLTFIMYFTLLIRTSLLQNYQ